MRPQPSGEADLSRCVRSRDYGRRPADHGHRYGAGIHLFPCHNHRSQTFLQWAAQPHSGKAFYLVGVPNSGTPVRIYMEPAQV